MTRDYIMDVKTDTDLLLGDALEVILEEERRRLPVITEYLFERAVLDILENPFGKDALQRYGQFVGELTKPMNVVDNHEQTKVLFTIPALVLSPITTIPTERGMTADMFLKSLSRDMDLGGRHVNEKIRQFMMSMTARPDYLETVIYPIQHILTRYGREMVALPGVETAPAGAPKDNPVAPTSSFTEEYDD